MGGSVAELLQLGGRVLALIELLAVQVANEPANALGIRRRDALQALAQKRQGLFRRRAQLANGGKSDGRVVAGELLPRALQLLRGQLPLRRRVAPDVPDVNRGVAACRGEQVALRRKRDSFDDV